jgi:GNAT superfamily N-acetyltransferase
VITVRPAVLADAEAMSDLLVASITALCVADHQNRPDAVSRWLANKTPDGVRQWFANPGNRLVVAVRVGMLAATGAINDKREIILNYVSPEYRFAGVSTALLAAMENALGPGAARLTSTATAHRFYLARGWTDAGELERYAGMVAYPMRKVL